MKFVEAYYRLSGKKRNAFSCSKNIMLIYATVKQ